MSGPGARPLIRSGFGVPHRSDPYGCRQAGLTNDEGRGRAVTLIQPRSGSWARPSGPSSAAPARRAPQPWPVPWRGCATPLAWSRAARSGVQRSHPRGEAGRGRNLQRGQTFASGYERSTAGSRFKGHLRTPKSMPMSARLNLVEQVAPTQISRSRSTLLPQRLTPPSPAPPRSAPAWPGHRVCVPSAGIASTRDRPGRGASPPQSGGACTGGVKPSRRAALTKRVSKVAKPLHRADCARCSASARSSPAR